MNRLVVAAAARADLKDIGAYIARDNPQRAESFLGELIAQMGDIADRPLSFPERLDWSPGIRSARHGRYYILFRVQSDRIEVIRVLHGSRDIPSILEGAA